MPPLTLAEECTRTEYKLTPVQQGMVMHSLLSPGCGAYIQQLVITLSEPLDMDAWLAAWQETVAQHEILRTRFNLGHAAYPFQEVLAQVDCRIHESARQEPASEQQLAAFLEEDRRRGFDPGIAPLWRWSLFRFSESDNRLVWTSHHALFDGRSRLLLVDELFRRYDAICREAPCHLEKPRPFADYVRWQSERQQDQGKGHWAGLLKGFRAGTSIPGRETELSLAPGEHSHRTLSCRLAPEQTAALVNFAGENAVTLNTLLQGAWALLLGLYSGSEDVVFGATRACRRPPIAGTERMVGLLINTLPVRVGMPASASLVGWLQLLRQQWVEGREYEQTPLTKVQQWSEIPRGEALFESVVVFEKFRLEEALWRRNPAWRTRRVRLLGITPYPLVVAGHLGAELLLEITYDRRRFDDWMMEQMPEHLETVLAAMAANPRATLQELPRLSRRELDRIVVQWNATATEYPRDKCIHHLFDEQAERTPDAVAVQIETQTLSYRELNQRADRLARHLVSAGVEPEALVAICVERSLDMIIGLLGTLKAGGVYWGLDDNAPVERFRGMLTEAKPRVLLTLRKNRASLAALAGEQSSLACTIVCIEDATASAATGNGAQLPRCTAGSPAYVCYTSGSTGRPHGVVAPHRGVVRLVKNCNYATLDGRETLLHLSPLSFDASTFEIWGALLNGGRLVLMPPGLPNLTQIGAAIRDRQITTLWLTAGLFHLMVDECLEDLKPLRQLLAGGDVLSPEKVRKARRALTGCRIINGYGPTENTTFTCCHEVKDDDPMASTVPIGRPIANTRVYVLTPALQLAPAGVKGELYAGGDGLAHGYLRQPELTASRFVPDPFSSQPGAKLYRTGDLARWRNDGSLEFLGRLDNQVKIRGFRVEPSEIEEALRRFEPVSDAVVVHGEGPAGHGQALTAYVAPRRPDAVSPGALRDFLAGILPDYMLPSTFVVLPKLPLSANGKIDRRQLPAPVTPHRNGNHAYTLPHGLVEEQLVGIFAELLRREDVGVEDDFFELGGDSLLALQAALRVQQVLGIEMLASDLYLCRTASGLAGKLGAGNGEGAKAGTAGPVKVPRDGPVPLLGTQLGYWYVHRKHPDAPPWNICRAWRIRGRLAVGAMRQAIESVVQRHEALRTHFVDVGGQPRQIVAPARPVELPLVDMRSLAGEALEAEILRVINEESLRRFDLERELLLHPVLLLLNDTEHVLIFTFPHIITDGVSLAAFSRDLAGFYEALVAGRSPQLPELPAQPYDYAVWQEDQLETDAVQRSLAYWRRHLEPQLLEIESSVCKPLVATTGFLAVVQSLALPMKLAEALKDLGRETRCSYSTVLFAALNVLQYAMTGRERGVMALVLEGRHRPEISNLMGCFRNCMVLCTWLRGDPNFREILRRARDAINGAHSHPQVALESVFPDRQPAILGGWPGVLFNFNFMTAGGQELQLPELKLAQIHRTVDLVAFPFTLTTIDQSDSTRLFLKGRAGRVTEVDLQLMLARFIELLGRLVAMPEAPLSAMGPMDFK